MLYTFDDTIPATNNNPSDDQPGMLVNNQSTLSILGVDHITFNFNNGGQHKAITFNQDASYVPASFPVTPPQLFTNDIGGLAQLFYYSGSMAQSADQYVSGTNGSTFLFGGIILKWGQSSISTSSPTTVTFASAFPNACLSVQLTNYNPTVALGVSTILSISTTSFTARASQSIPNAFYIAIGY